MAAARAAPGDLIAAPRHAPAGAADPRQHALAIREACRQVVAQAWEEALASGLCDEGAFEVALGALSRVSADELLRRAAELRPR